MVCQFYEISQFFVQSSQNKKKKKSKKKIIKTYPINKRSITIHTKVQGH